MNAPGDPTQLIDEAERFLVAQLSLSPVELPSHLQATSGQWKSAPVTITTRAYDGGVVRYARFATVQGAGLQIGNLLVLADPTYVLPILGSDLVALGVRPTMLAADLSPVFLPDPGGQQWWPPSVLPSAIGHRCLQGRSSGVVCGVVLAARTLYARGCL